MLEADVGIRDLTNKEARVTLGSKFNRLLLMDLIMTDYLMDINGQERTDLKDGFVDAVNFTTFLIRRALFASYMDIIEFERGNGGDGHLSQKAYQLLEHNKQYRNREVPSGIDPIHLKGAQSTVINNFIVKQVSS